MAVVIERANLDLKIQFTINEDEARALDALAGYGDDSFIKAFYEKLGKCYMDRHEEGLRSFLKTIRDGLTPILSRTDEARKLFLKKGGG